MTIELILRVHENHNRIPIPLSIDKRKWALYEISESVVAFVTPSRSSSLSFAEIPTNWDFKEERLSEIYCPKKTIPFLHLFEK